MKKKILVGAMFFLFAVSAAGCTRKKEPVTLTIWHVYGGQTDSPLNDMIETFNETVGKEQGIEVQATMVSNTNTIHDSVLAAANQDLGASKLPDLFSCYPKTVLAMPDASVLADYRDYFTEEELNRFIPSFVNEGVVDDRLVVLPVAKSTEIMFINKTLFDRFAEAVGAKLEDLNTWDGLFKMSEDYYRWTDEQTPDIAGDGKTFFVHDYHFNYFQVGVESLGENFFAGDKLAFGEQMKRVWDPYARAAVDGGVWLQKGYATEPLRTGDAVVSVASSASVLYYEDIVTYSNNISEPIEMIARPVPVFEDGRKLVMQRGAGICMAKSTPEREKAAAVFLKWLTEPHNNTEFCTNAGYMPVTDEAFTYLPEKIEKITNPKYKSLYEAFIDTQSSYTFYEAPQIDTYLELEMKFEDNVRGQLQEGNRDYRDYLMKVSEAEAASENRSAEEVCRELADECYVKLRKKFE